MYVIEARNVNDAAQHAYNVINKIGVERGSRNGPVLVSPYPVTTVYLRPWERVLFGEKRDANPFFHLYESMWMLAGRRDLDPLLRYVKNFSQFSDDTSTLHGAYGYRWRKMFGTDQLDVIVERLKKNPEDRRCVLQMWSAIHDLDINSRDIPCNDTATFQIGHDGKLNLVVFCRSNDIVLGCYGANAVHFSFLLEYMAVRIGVPMGTYSQVSVNWHAYISTLDKLKYDTSLDIQPYDNLDTIPIPFENTDRCLLDLLKNVDEQDQREDLFNTPWMDTVWRVMLAHQRYRLYPPPYRFEFSLNALAKSVHVTNDWIVGATQWLERRYRTWRDH